MGCMSHILLQIRQIPCGLSDFDKNFMEQYHQTGYGFDVLLKHVKNVDKKGNIVAAMLHLGEHPATKNDVQWVVDQHTEVKQKKTIK